jgi:hypothetical protein
MKLGRRGHEDTTSTGTMLLSLQKRRDSPASSSYYSHTTIKERLFRCSYRYLLYLILPAIALLRLLATLPFPSSTRNAPSLVKAPNNFIPRTCPPPTYSLQNRMLLSPGTICLTTLTDEAAGSWYQKLVRWRNFDNLMSITWDNKLHYVQKHGCKCM